MHVFPEGLNSFRTVHFLWGLKPLRLSYNIASLSLLVIYMQTLIIWSKSKSRYLVNQKVYLILRLKMMRYLTQPLLFIFMKQQKGIEVDVGENQEDHYYK